MNKSMMRAYLIFIFAVAASHVVFGEFCELPSQKQLVDWNRVNNHWFEAVNVNDPIDQESGCFLLRHSRSTPEGARFVFIDYRGQEPYKEIPVHVTRQPSGSYLWDVNVGDKGWHNYKFHTDDAEKQANKEIPMFFTDHAYYTDYETYVIDMMCQEDGKKLIWFQSLRQYPIADDILPAINKLKELGEGWEQVPLFQSGCSFKDPFPGDASK